MPDTTTTTTTDQLARQYAPDLPAGAPGVGMSANGYQNYRRMAFIAGYEAARGSADAETLRAEVDHLLDANRRLAFERDAWRDTAHSHKAERDAARTEAATLRTAIHDLYRSVAVRGIKEGTTVETLANHVAESLRPLIDAHPAPEDRRACSFCGQQRDDLSTGGDMTACGDCRSEADK